MLISVKSAYSLEFKLPEWKAKCLSFGISLDLKLALFAYRLCDFWLISESQWSPGGSDGKASARSVGNSGSIPGSGRSPGEGNGNPLQYSCLENSMDGGAWWAAVHGVTKSCTWLSDFTFLWVCFFIYKIQDSYNKWNNTSNLAWDYKEWVNGILLSICITEESGVGWVISTVAGITALLVWLDKI